MDLAAQLSGDGLDITTAAAVDVLPLRRVEGEHAVIVEKLQEAGRGKRQHLAGRRGPDGRPHRQDVTVDTNRVTS